MAKITIMRDRCKGCLLCTTVCPKKILKQDDKKLNAKGYYPTSITDMSECIGCGRCAIICPDCVIKVEK